MCLSAEGRSQLRADMGQGGNSGLKPQEAGRSPGLSRVSFERGCREGSEGELTWGGEEAEGQIESRGPSHSP